jgi:hypothetical protein
MTYGYGGSHSRLSSPAKAGHLNLNCNFTNRNLTHLAPCLLPSFPSYPVAVLQGLTPDS